MGLEGSEAGKEQAEKMKENKKKKVRKEKLRGFYSSRAINHSMPAAQPPVNLKLKWLPRYFTPTYLFKGRERLSPQKAL